MSRIAAFPIRFFPVDAECPAVVTEVYNLLMKSNSSVAHDIYEEKLKPPDYREVLLKTAQYAKSKLSFVIPQKQWNVLFHLN